MRHYDKFKLPHGLKRVLLESFEKAAPYLSWRSEDWRQRALDDMHLPAEGKYAEKAIREALVKAVNDATGLSIKAASASIVVHSSRYDIPCHTDRMARTCFLVPLACTPTMRFYEDFENRPLAGAKLLRFNDHNEHGVSNPYGGRMVLLSLSLEQR